MISKPLSKNSIRRLVILRSMTYWSFVSLGLIASFAAIVQMTRVGMEGGRCTTESNILFSCDIDVLMAFLLPMCFLLFFVVERRLKFIPRPPRILGSDKKDNIVRILAANELESHTKSVVGSYLTEIMSMGRDFYDVDYDVIRRWVDGEPDRKIDRSFQFSLKPHYEDKVLSSTITVDKKGETSLMF